MVMPARARACRDASTGPRPMISGERPDTPGGDDAGQRREAELAGLGVAHDDHGGGAVVERAAVAGGDRAVLAEDRVEALHALEGDAGAGAVVARSPPCRRAASRAAISRSKNPSAMAFSARFWLVTPHSSWRCAGDAARGGDVLGGLAHREVDVGQQALARAGRSRSRWSVAISRAAGRGVGEQRVLVVAVGAARAGPVGVLRDALDAAGDEDVALAGLDRVEGHPRRLHRRGAEPVDRGARQVVEPGEHRRRPGPCWSRACRTARRSPSRGRRPVVGSRPGTWRAPR